MRSTTPEKVQMKCKRFQAARKRKGISFKKLEQITGIDRTQLCTLSKVDKGCFLFTIGAISNGLETTISYLAGEIDFPGSADEINRLLQMAGNNRKRSAA